MRKILSVGLWMGWIMVASGCGGVDTVCGAQITFEHDLSSIFDDDCNVSSCMGEDGSDFKITLAPATQTISGSTCPGVQDGPATSNASVERAGDVLTISVGLEDLSFSLSGNDLSTPDQELADEACKNNLTNIQGSLDYNAKTLMWSYDLTVTDLGGCFL